MATFAEAAIQFIGQDSALKSKLTEMEKAISESAQRMASGVTIAMVGVGASIAAAGVGLSVLVKQSADVGEELQKFSQRIAISVETLSGYKVATDRADISLEDFGGALQKASRNMVEAVGGTGAAADAFKTMGVSVTDSNGKLKTVEAVMLEVSDKFMAMEDGAQKTAFAMDIFGKSGATLIPFLNQGSAAIAAQRKEADLLGVTWTAAQAQMAGAFNDTLKDLNNAMAGFRNAVAQYLMPFATSILTSILDQIKEWGASGQLKLWALATGEAIVGAFVAAAEAVGSVAKAGALVADTFRVIAGALHTLEAGVEQYVRVWLKGVELIVSGLASVAELLHLPGAAKIRDAAEWTKEWGQTFKFAGEQAADAAVESYKAIGTANAMADKLAANGERLAQNFREWGAAAIASASKAAGGIGETTEKTAKAMTEVLTYEVDGVTKYMTVAVTKAGAGVAEVVTSQIGTMVDAAKKAAEDLAKQQEQLAGKRRQAAPEQLDRLKQFAEEKGYDTERVTPEDLKRWQGEMDYEQGQQPNVGQQFLGGMPTSFGALQQGLKDTSQRFNDQKLFGELGSPAEIIAGALGGPAAPAVPGAALAGAALSSPAAGMADATKAHLDATYDIVDQGVGKMEERVSRGVEYVNQALPQAIEEMFVRKLMDQASRQ